MTGTEYDVVIVGGGPAGSSAGVFTGRYGLDTLVFDRGSAALRRSAFLSNYLGFPGGIDIDTFYELMAAHVERAGCEQVAETVETVERAGDGFRVETNAGTVVAADYVLAAAWYDGSYLRALGDGAMFTEQVHHGETEERFDPTYPDADGRTPVDGLYVAAPSGENAQAVMSAGVGARTARALIEDHRRSVGYPDGVATHYDWLRRESEFNGEWAERERWREWFENEAGDHDLHPERFVELRERHIDRSFGTALSEDEIEARTHEGTEALVDVLGAERLLDAMDDAAIESYLHGNAGSADRGPSDGRSGSETGDSDGVNGA